MFGEKKKMIQTPVDKIIQAPSLSFSYLWSGDDNKDHKAYVHLCLYVGIVVATVMEDMEDA